MTAVAMTLMDTLAKVERDAQGDTISIGDVVSSLQHRGFGTLLLIPSLLTVLPTGAIPMLPVVCGAFITLVCGQIVMGRRYPWLPKMVKKISITKTHYEKMITSSSMFINALDRVTYPRLRFLMHPISQRLIAVLCILLSILMAAVSLLPIASHILALAIFCFGLGLSTRDGIMTISGFIVMAVSLAFLPMIIISSQEFVGPEFIMPLPF